MPRVSKLSTIEGIGPANEAKLKAAGVKSVEGLLKACANKRSRADIATRTNIDEAKLLRFVNHADLMRIKGIGGEYSELLEAAGVDSTTELIQRRADNLAAKMVEVNKSRKLVRQVPAEKQVQDWIAQAKMLTKVVTH
jgi:predicted flap endonuclease-1-like 5' DNA nuclease